MAKQVLYNVPTKDWQAIRKAVLPKNRIWFDRTFSLLSAFQQNHPFIAKFSASDLKRFFGSVSGYEYYKDFFTQEGFFLFRRALQAISNSEEVTGHENFSHSPRNLTPDSWKGELLYATNSILAACRCLQSPSFQLLGEKERLNFLRNILKQARYPFVLEDWKVGVRFDYIEATLEGLAKTPQKISSSELKFITELIAPKIGPANSVTGHYHTVESVLGRGLWDKNRRLLGYIGFKVTNNEIRIEVIQGEFGSKRAQSEFKQESGNHWQNLLVRELIEAAKRSGKKRVLLIDPKMQPALANSPESAKMYYTIKGKFHFRPTNTKYYSLELF